MLNNPKVTRYIVFFLVALATIYFLFLVREVLLTFILGAILAYLLFRPVSYIERKGLKRIWAILLLYLLLAGGAVLVLTIAMPSIVEELTQLAEVVPKYAEQVEDMADKVETMTMPGKLNQIVNENIGKVENYLYNGIKRFVQGIYSFLGKVFAIIFSPILAFYIMNDWEKIREGFLGIFSPRVRRELVVLFTEIDIVLIEFLKGYLLVATFVGIMVGIAAAILGVNFPLLLGVLSGVTNLIPYFGAFLGGIPAVLVALSQSFRLAIYITIAIFLIQQIESNLITPKVIGDRLGMHPLLIVFALLAGGKLFGIWGMLFALPVAASLKVLLKWIYLKAVET